MSGLFGGGQQAPAPVVPVAPTTVAPPPDRSSGEAAGLAARQKARFNGAGSFTKNYLTGGGGSDGLSTTSRVLGGTS